MIWIGFFVVVLKVVKLCFVFLYRSRKRNSKAFKFKSGKAISELS